MYIHIHVHTHVRVSWGGGRMWRTIGYLRQPTPYIGYACAVKNLKLHLHTNQVVCTISWLTEKRCVVVEVGQPFGNTTVERKLPPLKWYYDLKFSKLYPNLSIALYDHLNQHLRCHIEYIMVLSKMMQLIIPLKWYFIVCKGITYTCVEWSIICLHMYTPVSSCSLSPDADSFQCMYGPCLEPVLAQTGLSFGRSSLSPWATYCIYFNVICNVGVHVHTYV